MPGSFPDQLMTKRKHARRPPARNTARLVGLALTLAAGVSLHSCTELPGERELAAAGARLQALLIGLGTAVRQQAGQASLPSAAPGPAGAAAGSAPAPSRPVRTAGTGGAFSACPQFFADGNPPVVKPRPNQRALCYDAFAILHSGESKTAVYVAQKLNRASIRDADEERSNKFFADARLPEAERAKLADYAGSGLDKGHLAPADQMPTVQAMAQSFSLANMVPQALRQNRGVWRTSVEAATTKYAARASGNVYVITGPVYAPSIAKSRAIGPGKVRVPKYLFKLVYDEAQSRAWAHWYLNNNAAQATAPISYAELVKRTGIEFLPGLPLVD
ncbi:MAG: non-specific endonuclease [Polaromonas sp.]|nr:non-specific endonuclease [Polaromonas sp.]